MFKHAGRLLYVETPLGEDVLHLEAFDGAEGFSSPFEYRLEMLSSEEGVDPAKIVGKGVAFQVIGDDGALATWHGVVRRFVSGGLHPSGMRGYQAIVVPWTWFLTKRSTCRIFQEKSVDEIVTQVFEDAGFTDFELNLSGSYPALTYCVQFRETDFDFVSRLLEEEGIFYYFRHEAERHVLVIADSDSAYSPCSQSAVSYSEGTLKADCVSRWVHSYEFVSGKWSHTDYNFETPTVDLYAETPTVVTIPGVEAHERYEYPGRYVDKSHGEAKTKALIEAEEAGHEVVEGASACHSFRVAGTFNLETHSFPSEEGADYAITSIRHSGRDDSYVQSGGSGSYYSNSFSCVPKSVVFRPKRSTPRPLIHGPQTAVVVGPSGEEIYTDEYGRIKVQFHWDREGVEDENSSCWVRVAQVWAGKKWGTQYLPRMGQEVIIDFLDGDPDRPLVTGSVFNADNMPIHDLPANKTQSGVKTRSTKNGGAEAFNEIRFEDKKDEEHIFIHAQKDEHHRVVNDHVEHIGNASHRTVGGDSFEKTTGDRHITQTGDQFELLEASTNLEVAVDRKVKIGGGDQLTVIGDQNAAVDGDQSLKIKGSQMISAGADIHREAAQNVNEKAGMDYAAEGGMNVHIKGGMNVVIEAGMQLTLKAGAGFITIGPAGVDISGPMVKINSGGGAGSGGGCKPEAPAAAVAPDAPEDPQAPMEKVAAATGSREANAPRPLAAGSVEWASPQAQEAPPATSPQAEALASASEQGAAFCPT
ncbi:MAG: type VI secretion system secreted protein VgrG [Planctomycetota bacterium]|jgi:type VI secretion system secreted protein VgrG